MSVRKKANSDANETNQIVLHSSAMKCCDAAPLTTKLYLMTADFTAGTTAIVVEDANGVDQTVTFDNVTTVSEIRKSIATALDSLGFDAYFCDNYMGINIPDDGSSITIIGEAIIKSITHNGGSAVAVVKSDMAPNKQYSGSVAFDTDPGFMAYDGSGGTQIATVGGFAAGDAAAVVTALETALTAEAVPFTEVTAVENTVSGAYDYTISYTGLLELLVDAARLKLDRTTPYFS